MSSSNYKIPSRTYRFVPDLSGNSLCRNPISHARLVLRRVENFQLPPHIFPIPFFPWVYFQLSPSICQSKSELCVSDIKTENFFLYRLTCFVMFFLDCRIFFNRLLWLFGLRQKKRTLDDADCLPLTSS